jgi:hypothetical protein
VPAVSPTLDAPTLLGLLVDTAAQDAARAWLGAGTERPATKAHPPWRVSPEGLTVFLI